MVEENYHAPPMGVLCCDAKPKGSQMGKASLSHELFRGAQTGQKTVDPGQTFQTAPTL